MIIFGSQRSTNGEFKPRIDKIIASDFDHDLHRRNIFLAPSSDATEMQFPEMGSNIVSKDE